MSDIDYWKECIATAAEELPLVLCDDELDVLALAVSRGHEHYGMAFYSPPSSDRLADIERQWQAKYAALEKELELYKSGAEKAIKRACDLHHDARVSINRDGNVFEHGGRTERVL